MAHYDGFSESELRSYCEKLERQLKMLEDRWEGFLQHQRRLVESFPDIMEGVEEKDPIDEYNYNDARPEVFCEAGVNTLLSVRERIRELLVPHPTFVMGDVLNCVSGSAWTIIACVDFLVERGKIVEITPVTLGGKQSRRQFKRRK